MDRAVPFVAVALAELRRWRGTGQLRAVAQLALFVTVTFASAAHADIVDDLANAAPAAVVVRAAPGIARGTLTEIDAVARAFAEGRRGKLRVLVDDDGRVDPPALHGRLRLQREDVVVVVDDDNVDLWSPSVDSDGRARARRAAARSGTPAVRLAAALAALDTVVSGSEARFVDAARAARDHQVRAAMETVAIAQAWETRLAAERARLVAVLSAQGAAAIDGFDEATTAVLRPLVTEAAARRRARVWLVQAPGGIAPRPLLDVYVDGGLGGADIVLTTNGFVWVARCAALGDQVEDVVASAIRAQPVPHAAAGGPPQGPAWTTMLVERTRAILTGLAAIPVAAEPSSTSDNDDRGSASTTASSEPPSASSGAMPSLGERPSTAVFTVGGAVTGVALLVARRRVLRTRRERFDDELRTLEHLVTEIFLAIDGSPVGSQLAARAVELRERVEMLRTATATKSTLALAMSTRTSLEDVRRQLAAG